MKSSTDFTYTVAVLCSFVIREKDSPGSLNGMKDQSRLHKKTSWGFADYLKWYERSLSSRTSGGVPLPTLAYCTEKLIMYNLRALRQRRVTLHKVQSQASGTDQPLP